MSDKPHFDISAAVVRQLGEELVSDEVTALIELVKNSYDADASYASIVVDTKTAVQGEEYFFSSSRNCEATQGYIIIEDDGIGMTRNEIGMGWLTISFSQKRRMRAEGRLTPKKARTPLGDKGLGRLSTQRLGSRLEMFTHRDLAFSLDVDSETSDRDSGDEHHVAFDWSQFTEDTALTAVPVFFESRTKQKPRKGTKLVITCLREPSVWQGQAKDDLVSRLAQLIFPFAEVRPFNVFLTIDGVRFDLATVSERIRDIAVSRFWFSFDETGDQKLHFGGKIKLARLRGIGDERIDQYEDIVEADQGKRLFRHLTDPTNRFHLEHAEYIGADGWFISFEDSRELKSLGPALSGGEIASPGPFSGEIDEFFLRGVNLDPLQNVFNSVANYKEFVSRHTGVRIFRDGFGVRPYGLDGHDWLNLGGGQTSGRSFYSLRPQNVIGFVALTARSNSQLREKTDREGFVDAPAARNFFLLMNQFVSAMDLLFNNLGRSYNELRRTQAEQSSGNEPPQQLLQDVREISTTARSVESQVTQLRTGLDVVISDIGEVVDSVRNTPLFASEREQALAPVLNDANAKLREAQSLLLELEFLLQKARRLGAIADSLEVRLTLLQEQLGQFSELAGLGLTAEALAHEIHQVADRLSQKTREITESLRKREGGIAELVTYTEYVQSAVSTLRKQINHLNPSLRYLRERKDKIHLAEFFTEMQVFYADRLSRLNMELKLEQSFEPFSIVMNRGKLTQVVDNLILNSEYWLREANGRGEVENPCIMVGAAKPFVTIYDNGVGIDPGIEPYLFQPFATTKPRKIGRGLGLFIVRELLDSSGCSISLLQERNSSDRRFKFQLDLSGAIDAK